MKTRYRLTCRGSRGGKFYCVDTQTGKRASLKTGSEEEARQLVEAKNQAQRQCRYAGVPLVLLAHWRLAK